MSKRRIYIPFEDYSFVGGPSTFMANLHHYLESRKFETADSVHHSAGIFFPIKYNPDILRYVKESGGAIIQRLDGIWYPEKHGAEYRRFNQPVAEIYRYFADHIVFQSEYSKRQCFEMFGPVTTARYSTVVNGVDTATFFPSETAWDGNATLRFVTTGNLRHRSMIEPIVLALDRMDSDLAFEFHVVGPIAADLRTVCDRPYIRWHGECSADQVAVLLRNSHVFVYSHLNPPCPNSVIEAVATGLPVTGFASGAMSELLPFGTDLLAPVSDALFHAELDLDPTELANVVERTARNYPDARERALQHIGDYAFKKTGDAYLSVFVQELTQAKARMRSTPKMRRFVRSRMFHVAKRVSRKVGLHVIAQRFAKEFMLTRSPSEARRHLMDALTERLELVTPSEALAFLFGLDKQIYESEGKWAIRYDNGTHTKHRHIGYHTFFTKNITRGDRILDVGCGRGELSYAMAETVGTEGLVWGVDRRVTSIEHAKSHFVLPQLKFMLGDVTSQLPEIERINVITLSNVLEHLEERPTFLAKLSALYKPATLLVRVPCYERDWRVPLQDEIGFDYRLDAEHQIEYTTKQFEVEMRNAGLCIAASLHVWGEIWAVLKPRKADDLHSTL